MKRLVLLLLVAALSSCKAERQVATPVKTAAQEPAGPADLERRQSTAAYTSAPDVGPGATNGVEGGTTAAAPPPAVQKMPRMIVRTAEVRVVVTDAQAASRALAAAAEAAGGYVGDARTWREGEQMRGTLTLRVPAVKLSAVLEAVRKSGIRVESETVSSDDVSQEYVDLASQLRNQEAAETELRALMTDVRQKTKSAMDVLQMYQQLATVRGDVEKTKGRMQFIEQTAAMSTIKVELIPDAVAKPVVEPGWQPVAIVKDASRALVGTLQWLATVLIWFAIYVVPVLLLLILPIILGVRVLRRRGMNAA